MFSSNHEWQGLTANTERDLPVQLWNKSTSSFQNSRENIYIKNILYMYHIPRNYFRPITRGTVSFVGCHYCSLLSTAHLKKSCGSTFSSFSKCGVALTTYCRSLQLKKLNFSNFKQHKDPIENVGGSRGQTDNSTRQRSELCLSSVQTALEVIRKRYLREKQESPFKLVTLANWLRKGRPCSTPTDLLNCFH